MRQCSSGKAKISEQGCVSCVFRSFLQSNPFIHIHSGKKKLLNFNILSLSKRERKSNYSVDNYFKDTLRAGPSKMDKAHKIPRAPKQIAMWVLSANFSYVMFNDDDDMQPRLPILPS